MSSTDICANFFGYYASWVNVLYQRGDNLIYYFDKDQSKSYTVPHCYGTLKRKYGQRRAVSRHLKAFQAILRINLVKCNNTLKKAVFKENYFIALFIHYLSI